MYKQILLCLPSNYKSLVNIFKGCRYGQSPQILLLTLLCSSRQTVRQFASDKVYNIGRYYELCLTRVLNHNLLQLLIKQQYKLPKNSKIKYSKTSTHKRQTKKHYRSSAVISKLTLKVYIKWSTLKTE